MTQQPPAGDGSRACVVVDRTRPAEAPIAYVLVSGEGPALGLERRTRSRVRRQSPKEPGFRQGPLALHRG
jgi:hypothetical protein